MLNVPSRQGGFLARSSLLQTPRSDLAASERLASASRGSADGESIGISATATAMSGETSAKTSKPGWVPFHGPKWRKEGAAAAATPDKHANRDVLASLSQLRMREVLRLKTPARVHTFQRADLHSQESKTTRAGSDSDASATPQSEDVVIKSLENSRTPIILRNVAGKMGPSNLPQGFPFSVPLPPTLSATSLSSSASVATGTRYGLKAADAPTACEPLTRAKSLEQTRSKSLEQTHEAGNRQTLLKDCLDGSSMFDSCSGESLVTSQASSDGGSDKSYPFETKSQRKSPDSSKQVLRLTLKNLVMLGLKSPLVSDPLRLEQDSMADRQQALLQSLRLKPDGGGYRCEPLQRTHEEVDEPHQQTHMEANEEANENDQMSKEDLGDSLSFLMLSTAHSSEVAAGYRYDDGHLREVVAPPPLMSRGQRSAELSQLHSAQTMLLVSSTLTGGNDRYFSTFQISNTDTTHSLERHMTVRIKSSPLGDAKGIADPAGSDIVNDPEQDGDQKVVVDQLQAAQKSFQFADWINMPVSEGSAWWRKLRAQEEVEEGEPKERTTVSSAKSDSFQESKGARGEGQRWDGCPRGKQDAALEWHSLAAKSDQNSTT